MRSWRPLREIFFGLCVNENEVAKQIVDAAYRVHTSLGPGLLESVEAVAPLHKKQLLTHLLLADRRLGLLINFNVYC